MRFIKFTKFIYLWNKKITQNCGSARRKSLIGSLSPLAECTSQAADFGKSLLVIENKRYSLSMITFCGKKLRRTLFSIKLTWISVSFWNKHSLWLLNDYNDYNTIQRVYIREQFSNEFGLFLKSKDSLLFWFNFLETKNCI